MDNIGKWGYFKMGDIQDKMRTSCKDDMFENNSLGLRSNDE